MRALWTQARWIVGTTGTILFGLASAAMPVFAVTGWMMYLLRRR